MARPPKTTIDYFPHFADRTDETLLRIVEEKYGNDGYAFWYKLRERLCNQPGLFLSRNNITEWEFLLTITRQCEDSADNMLELLAKIGVIDAELWHKQRIVWIQRLADDVADVYVRRKTTPPTRPRQKETEKGCCDINVSADEFVLTETHLDSVIVDGIPPETERSGVIDSISTQTKLNQIKQKQTTTTGSVADSNNDVLTRITTILGTDVAQRWLTERGPAYCQAQLDLVDRKAATVTSARAYLQAALAGNFANWQQPPPRPDPRCPHCGGRGAVTDFTNNKTRPCTCISHSDSAGTEPPVSAPDPNRRDTAALAARVAAARTP